MHRIPHKLFSKTFVFSIDKSSVLWYYIKHSGSGMFGAAIILDIFGEVLKLAEEAPLLRV